MSTVTTILLWAKNVQVQCPWSKLNGSSAEPLCQSVCHTARLLVIAGCDDSKIYIWDCRLMHICSGRDGNISIPSAEGGRGRRRMRREGGRSRRGRPSGGYGYIPGPIVPARWCPGCFLSSPGLSSAVLHCAVLYCAVACLLSYVLCPLYCSGSFASYCRFFHVVGRFWIWCWTVSFIVRTEFRSNVMIIQLKTI